MSSERGLLTAWRSPGNAAAASPASLAVRGGKEGQPAGHPRRGEAQPRDGYMKGRRERACETGMWAPRKESRGATTGSKAKTVRNREMTDVLPQGGVQVGVSRAKASRAQGPGCARARPREVLAPRPSDPGRRGEGGGGSRAHGARSPHPQPSAALPARAPRRPSSAAPG